MTEWNFDVWHLPCSLSLASCRYHAEALARRLHSKLWSAGRFGNSEDSHLGGNHFQDDEAQLVNAINRHQRVKRSRGYPRYTNTGLYPYGGNFNTRFGFPTSGFNRFTGFPTNGLTGSTGLTGFPTSGFNGFTGFPTNGLTGSTGLTGFPTNGLTGVPLSSLDFASYSSRDYSQNAETQLVNRINRLQRVKRSRGYPRFTNTGLYPYGSNTFGSGFPYFGGLNGFPTNGFNSFNGFPLNGLNTFG